MATVRHTPQAEADLEDILRALNQNYPATAERYAAEFERKGQMLAQFPEIGRSRPELAPNLRSLLVRPYILFYRIQGDEVQILRILHGKRDLASILKQAEDDAE